MNNYQQKKIDKLNEIELLLNNLDKMDIIPITSEVESKLLREVGKKIDFYYKESNRMHKIIDRNIPNIFTYLVELDANLTTVQFYNLILEYINLLIDELHQENIKAINDNILVSDNSNSQKSTYGKIILFPLKK